ncbi:uncharacterized protein G2W53_022856 [Senna tora]|uniref:Uncharacterized protein n=1 Tax=Senna tora TaxID=362788 RepID=A0A834TND9_9FABA|nr:uncharacterized protein G2W53_022856 [Senna tora]
MAIVAKHHRSWHQFTPSTSYHSTIDV